jgi:hypothetical protein
MQVDRALPAIALLSYPLLLRSRALRPVERRQTHPCHFRYPGLKLSGRQYPGEEVPHSRKTCPIPPQGQA